MTAHKVHVSPRNHAPDRADYEVYLRSLARINIVPAMLGGANLSLLLDRMQAELPSLRFSRGLLRQFAEQELCKQRRALEDKEGSLGIW